MKSKKTLSHEFVQFIPDNLKENIIYISMEYATIAHRCCCGCGIEVITPLSPTDWKLIFDGQSISLYPSIGNWNFACQSHYWIKTNKVKWARTWTQEEIKAGRTYNKEAKKRYFEGIPKSSFQDDIADNELSASEEQKNNIWQKMKKWLF